MTGDGMSHDNIATLQEHNTRAPLSFWRKVKGSARKMRSISLLHVALTVLLSCHSPSSLHVSAAAASSTTTTSPTRSRQRRRQGSSGSTDPYDLLSSAIQNRISQLDSADNPGGATTTSISTSSIRRALQSLSQAQSALKGIDGASHELYQRTHKSASSELVVEGTGEDDDKDDNDSGQSTAAGPAGRAARSAARLGIVADGLWAAELCELVERPTVALRPQQRRDDAEDKDDDDDEEEEGDDDAEAELLDNALTIGEGREVWLNTTTGGTLPINVLVLYEKSYGGGVGYNHGGIDGIAAALEEPADDVAPRGGRLVVVLGDEYGNDLPATVSILDQEQRIISLDRDGSAAEAGLPPSARMASVCGPLYDAARDVLESIRPALTRAEGADANDDDDDDDDDATPRRKQRRSPTTPYAIHFVGRSLAGGVGALAATMLDGILPLEVDEGEKSESEEAKKTLGGFGRGRTSAFTLGPPPCLSNNIKADFIKSVIHGDDAICRTTRESIDRLCRRTRRVMKGNPLGAKLGWMSNAVSLTVSGVKAHAKGKKGGEKHLSVPGMVYLVRPRRYEGSSIHEVSSSQGAIKVRSAVLWQLNDVLLSKSLWAHHSLDAYIRGLNRVQLRSLKAA